MEEGLSGQHRGRREIINSVLQDNVALCAGGSEVWGRQCQLSGVPMEHFNNQELLNAGGQIPR